MKGIAIITKKSARELKTILMSIDNTFGPLGSGGYEVREKEKIGDVFVIHFTQLDCKPAKIYPAFIINGTIYATKIAGAIIGALIHEGVIITTKSDNDLPDCIEKYLNRIGGEANVPCMRN